MSFTRKLSVLIALVLNQAATAQEGYLGQGHDKWHSFYQGLQRPDTKAPCCNLTEAQSSVLRRCASGDLGILRRNPRLLARTNEAMENHFSGVIGRFDFRVVRSA